MKHTLMHPNKKKENTKNSARSKAHRENFGHLVLPAQIGALVHEALVEDVEGELVLGLYRVPEVVLATRDGPARSFSQNQVSAGHARDVC